MADSYVNQGIGGDGVNVVGGGNKITNIKTVNNPTKVVRGTGGEDSSGSAGGFAVLGLLASILVVHWFGPRAQTVVDVVRLGGYVAMLISFLDFACRILRSEQNDNGSALQSILVLCLALVLGTWLIGYAESMIQPWYPQMATVNIGNFFHGQSKAIFWVVRNALGTVAIGLTELIMIIRALNTGANAGSVGFLSRVTGFAQGWWGIVFAVVGSVISALMLQPPEVVSALEAVARELGL